MSVQQLPLQFSITASSRSEDFIRAESNAFALDMISSWPDWSSRIVTLVGPRGSGKTHLAHIWQEITGAEFLAVSDLICPDEKSTVKKGAFILEDVDQQTFDETMFFHLINIILSTKTHLLMTANISPASWEIKLPDLKSRLSLANVVTLEMPDEWLIKMVMQKLFSDRQLDVDPSVLEFVVRRMDRSLRAAQSLVAKIDEVALANKRKITKSLVRDVLDN